MWWENKSRCLMSGLREIENDRRVFAGGKVINCWSGCYGRCGEEENGIETAEEIAYNR